MALKSCATTGVRCTMCEAKEWIDVDLYGNSYSGLSPSEAIKLGTWLVKAGAEMRKILEEKKK